MARRARKRRLDFMAIAVGHPILVSRDRGRADCARFRVGASRMANSTLLDCACFNITIVRSGHRALDDRRKAAASHSSNHQHQPSNPGISADKKEGLLEPASGSSETARPNG